LLESTTLPEGADASSRWTSPSSREILRSSKLLVELSALARAAGVVVDGRDLEDRSPCDVWSHKEDYDGCNSRSNDWGDGVAWDGASNEEVVLGLLPVVRGVFHEIA
jgi:hypothetical protein